MNKIEIPLPNKGLTAIIDEADAPLVTPYRWYAMPGTKRKTIWYAARTARGRGPTILMHRVIMQPPYPLVVDHIDHNGLNNTRANMRLVTRAENCRRRRRGEYNSSGYRGVHPAYGQAPGKWIAVIRINDKGRHLGTFDTKEEAARAYHKAAVEAWGEFAPPLFT